MSQALYRKYRSKNLEDVLGQEHITSILSRALKRGKIAHAYLLTGPRGTGKTSVARILAHEINQLPYTDESSHLDIIEIDAASNNGVDDIRDLREKARIAPVLAKFKIYIIDEVHMLSKQAFNALLKTLEEPPEHVIFILATTNADKLPDTILSRVQQFYFRPIAPGIISSHLINISKREGFTLEPDAADLIAERSNGGFRDSISLLDQLSGAIDESGVLDVDLVNASLGLSESELIDRLIDSYLTSDHQMAIRTLDNLYRDGADPKTIVDQLLSSLQKRLVDEPSLVELMVKLISISSSKRVDLQLLTALLSNETVSNSKSTPPPKITKKNEKKITPTAPKPANDVKPAPTEPLKENDKPLKNKSVIKKNSDKIPENFDWPKFLEQSKNLSMNLFGILSKSNYAYNDGELTLFVMTKFAQKRLNSASNMPLLHKAIQASQQAELTVIIKPSAKPPTDEKLAEVAEMMGGGVEVNLEEMK